MEVDGAGPGAPPSRLPSSAALEEDSGEEDSSTAHASTHRTLHGWLARSWDAAENEAAFENISHSLALVVDLLRSCFPPDAEQRVDGPKSWSKWRSAQSSAATAAAAAARQLALLKAHLVHHPSDHDGWMALADHLDVVKDLALNDAAKHVPSAEWRASESASELARGLRLRIRRACHAAVASATTDAQRVAAHERAGLAAFEEACRETTRRGARRSGCAARRSTTPPSSRRPSGATGAWARKSRASSAPPRGARWNDSPRA